MESIMKIVKRDGRTVDFDVDKITEAIFKAAQVRTEICQRIWRNR